MANSSAVEGESVFAERFRGHEGPYHLYDAGDRPLIRSETGAHVLGALLEGRTRLVFLDETGAKTNLTRLRGRAPRGERVHASSPPRPLAYHHHDLLDPAGRFHRLHDHRGGDRC